ncbi:MobD.1 conserved hypothetical protein [Escherichia phage vB_EcoM_VR7]|uniref:Uncharacterized protein mobD.1 n=1 Tax=Escherichia phage vB_EcoM_VR7 TaxID=700939 RepID=E5FIU6_9CAUD|nr:MobD.1 conserved hypothetical protein [Escherichia phage vB_EcoM_VR7]ADR32478.1 MobD.1 conserved hypothetical protein [Escherichia phage vB_EcoM_VR7]
MIIETTELFGELTAEVVNNAIELSQEDDKIVLTIHDIKPLYDLMVLDKDGYLDGSFSGVFDINDDVCARIYKHDAGFNIETDEECLSISDSDKFFDCIFKLFQEECVPELEWKIPGCDAIMHSSETFEGDEEGDYNTEFSVHQHQGRDMLSIIQTHDGEAEVVFTKDELKVLVKYLNTVIPTMNA